MVASEKERLEMRLQLAQSSSKKKSKNKREPSSSGGSPRKSSSRRRAGKENKTDKVKDAAKVASKRKTTVQWSKEDQFHYTHTLLNIIEESPRYRQIYGFDKGTSQDVQTGGLTVQGVSREVAEKVFVNQPNSPFKPSDLTSLTKVVSNRVNALKKMFREWKQELGQTGHGLVEEDRLDEIVPGSKLANVWDALQKKFPWYQQIQRMMGRSPLVDRSALTNSLTPVNLDVLATSTGSQAIGSGDENGSDNMDADSQHSQPITESWSDSQKCEDSDSEDDSPSSSGSESDGDKSLVPTPVSYSKTKHASAHATPTTSSSSARPRKMNDLVYDIATQDRTQRLRITEVKAKEKTRRAEKKMKIKADVEMARLRVRQAELDHQAREAEKQRAHERDMLDRQMALAQLHAGGPPQLGFPALDPRLR